MTQKEKYMTRLANEVNINDVNALYSLRVVNYHKKWVLRFTGFKRNRNKHGYI